MGNFASYEGSIVILPSVRKDYFLKARITDPQVSFSLLTIEEAEALFDYSYDERALAYLITLGDSYDLALEKLKFISKMKEFHDETFRLNELSKIRESLLFSGLLYRLPNPERNFINHHVIVSGYHDTRRINELLCELPNMAVSIQKDQKVRDSALLLHEFSDVFEEMHFVLNQVAITIVSGVSPDDIYLYGLSNEHLPLLKEFASRLGLHIAGLPGSRLTDSPLYSFFINEWESKGPLEALKQVSEAYPDANSIPLFRKLASSFQELTPSKRLKTIREMACSLEIPETSYSPSINLLKSSFVPSSGHVFILNFALGTFPGISKDEDYLDDREKKILSLQSSRELTEANRAELVYLLSSGLVDCLSFSHKVFGQASFLSPLVDELSIPVDKENKLDFEYFQDGGKFLYSSLFDDFSSFQKDDPRLLSYLHKHGSPDRNFPYQFTPFELHNEAKKLKHSYSSIDKFYSCPFKYYLTKILGLEDFTPSFEARAGTIFHEILSNCHNVNFDFEEAFKEAKSREELNGPFSPKEEVYLDIKAKQVKAALELILEHEANMETPSFASEMKFNLSIPSHPLISLIGSIDKVICTGSEGYYLTLVDYKSSLKQVFRKKGLDDGKSLQLPFYAYAASLDPNFQNKSLLGLFISPFFLPSNFPPKNVPLEKYFEDSFKLNGIWKHDEEGLASLDSGYASSRFIYSLKTTNAGLGECYGRCLPEADFQELLEIAKEKIIEADERIRKGDFPIAPLINQSNDSCQFCSFRDVCCRDDSMINEGKKENLEEEDEQ